MERRSSDERRGSCSGVVACTKSPEDAGEGRRGVALDLGKPVADDAPAEREDDRQARRRPEAHRCGATARAAASGPPRSRLGVVLHEVPERRRAERDEPAAAESASGEAAARRRRRCPTRRRSASPALAVPCARTSRQAIAASASAATIADAGEQERVVPGHRRCERRDVQRAVEPEGDAAARELCDERHQGEQRRPGQPPPTRPSHPRIICPLQHEAKTRRAGSAFP